MGQQRGAGGTEPGSVLARLRAQQPEFTRALRRVAESVLADGRVERRHRPGDPALRSTLVAADTRAMHDPVALLDLAEANSRGAVTIALTSNPRPPLAGAAGPPPRLVTRSRHD